MSRLYYYEHAGELNRELKREIPADRLKELHHKQPWRHFLIAGRQLLLLVLLPYIIWSNPSPWIWVPASILQGFVVFSFTILLHEAIHKCIFNRDPHGLSEKLAFLYGTISGLAASQFKRWHLDHHNQLGSETEDPKRAHLSPKRNARWYKFLYCTPALYPIYFRAAATAQKKYPEALRARIRKERFISIGFHLTVLIWFFTLSPWFAVKATIIPLFFVFPTAFTLNRLGQHYLVDPDDVARWSTLMRPNGFWNLLFLFSSYHLEHHYFPGVPFYKLKPLQKELDGFYERRRIPTVSYATLLKAWFWHNHKPHTRWESEAMEKPVTSLARSQEGL